MKVFILLSTVLILTGCGGDNIPNYLKNKVVWDSQGCAFLLRKNLGDSMFLDFSKELSKDTCKFELK